MHTIANSQPMSEARVENGIRQLDIFTAMCGSVRRLSHTSRYETFRAIWRENVAEHSFYAGFLAWLIATDLNRLGVSVDADRAGMEALLGDLEEAMTADAITIFKNSNPDLKREIKKAGKICMGVMADEFMPLHREVFAAWEGSGTFESKVAKFADLLCVAMYAREEAKAGNDAFAPVVRDIHSDMRQFREDENFGRYIRGIWPNDEANDLLRTTHNAVHFADRYPGRH